MARSQDTGAEEMKTEEEKVVGTVVKVTIGRDGYEYVTLEFEGFGRATIKRNESDENDNG